MFDWFTGMWSIYLLLKYTNAKFFLYIKIYIWYLFLDLHHILIVVELLLFVSTTIACLLACLLARSPCSLLHITVNREVAIGGISKCAFVCMCVCVPHAKVNPFMAHCTRTRTRTFPIPIFQFPIAVCGKNIANWLGWRFVMMHLLQLIICHTSGMLDLSQSAVQLSLLLSLLLFHSVACPISVIVGCPCCRFTVSWAALQRGKCSNRNRVEFDSSRWISVLFADELRLFLFW